MYTFTCKRCEEKKSIDRAQKYNICSECQIVPFRVFLLEIMVNVTVWVSCFSSGVGTIWYAGKSLYLNDSELLMIRAFPCFVVCGVLWNIIEYNYGVIDFTLRWMKQRREQVVVK